MLRSILARGSMISCPQPWQRILKSMPTRSTSKLEATGVRFLGLDHIADLYIHGSTPPFLC